MVRFSLVRGVCLACLIPILGMFAACSTISANSGPGATPPTIQWNILNKNTNATQQLTGNQSLSVSMGDSYTVTVHGLSPSGVKTLSLGGGASWTCASSGLGQNRTADYATQNTSQTPDSTGGVLDDIFLIQDVDVSLDCESGFTFSGGGISLVANATNFANQSVQATLGLNVS